MEKRVPRPPARADGSRGHGVPHRRERRRRRHPRRARAEFDAIVLAGGATAWRDLPIPGGARRHPPGDGVPAASATGCSRATSSRTPITAAGKHVVIIGGGDTGADCLGTAHRQGAASVHQFEILPRPPDSRAPTNPWPTWSNIFRVTSAHEEGGERVYSVNTECFLGDDDGNVAPCAPTRWRWSTAASRRSRAPTSSCRASSCSSRWASSAPERSGLVDQLGVKLDERGNVARRRVHDERAGRVRVRRHGPRPEPHRVGDRRGPLVRRGCRHVVDGRDHAPNPHRTDCPPAALGIAGAAPGIAGQVPSTNTGQASYPTRATGRWSVASRSCSYWRTAGCGRSPAPCQARPPRRPARSLH